MGWAPKRGTTGAGVSPVAAFGPRRKKRGAPSERSMASPMTCGAWRDDALRRVRALSFFCRNSMSKYLALSVVVVALVSCAQSADVGDTLPNEQTNDSADGGPADGASTTSNGKTADGGAFLEGSMGSLVEGGPGQIDGASGADARPVECARGMVACDARCVDVGLDPLHCGACGHACGASVCSDGMCATEALISSNVSGAAHILVDANGLYFANSGLIVRANLDGSGITYLTSLGTQDPGATGFLAMDDTSLYWATGTSDFGGAIFTCPKLLGAPKLLLDLGKIRPYGLAVDKTLGVLLFGNLGNGVLDPSMQPSIVGSTSTQIPAKKTLSRVGVRFLGGIAANATDVYATTTDSGLLVRVPRSGGDAVVVASGFVNVNAVALDSQNAYVVDIGGGPNHTKGGLSRISLVTGSSTLLAANLDNPYGLAVDGNYVYFTTQGTQETDYSDGAVWRVPRDGGPLLALARAQAEPTDIAVNATSAYWINSGLFHRAILRVTK